MYTLNEALQMVNNRGPRFAVIGSIRQGEAYATYAPTGEAAEKIADNFRERCYYQVRVHPPQGSVDLAALGRDRSDAVQRLSEATEILKAAVHRAVEEGRAEAEIARTAGIDRMTVRSWLGK